MKKVLIVLILFAFLMISVVPANADNVLVNAGKRIPVVYSGEKVSGKTVAAGDKLYAQVQSDVRVNSKLVFKQGGTVILNIADAKKARCWGNPGEILLINGSVEDANGNFHPIEYNHKITGEEKTWPKAMGAVSIFFLFPLALFGFVHGGQAEITTGKTINVMLMNDFNI